jgi:hypothetical protein
VPGVTLLIPHPHDVVFSKLERLDESDADHIRRVLREYPLTSEVLEAFAGETPYRAGAITDPERLTRFEYGLARLRGMIGGEEPTLE